MPLLATMYTLTTYGSWLRGDRRGWVDQGRAFPPAPALEANDRRSMKYPAFYFGKESLLQIGRLIGESLQTRLHQQIIAQAVRSWHVHFIVAASVERPPAVVKCAKDAVRYGLHTDRPIWTVGYDKRYCFDEPTLVNRVRYVERHNTELGWPARPWEFVVGI